MPVNLMARPFGPSYSKTGVKRPLSKRLKIGFQDQLWLNAGQKYCRMLPLEHSAMLSTFIRGYSIGVVRPHFLSVQNHISVPIGQI